MDELKALQEIFEDYQDLEAEAYRVQKTALKEGIKVALAIPNDTVLKFANEIFTPYQKAKYVLNEVISIKDVIQIRGYLSKLKIFRDDVVEISLANPKENKTYLLLQLIPGKYSFENLFQALSGESRVSDGVIINIMLITEGDSRKLAEQQAGIYNVVPFISQLKVGLVQQLELLQVLSTNKANKKNLLKERILLWGFNEEAFSKNFSQCLCPSDFNIKEVYRLHQVHDKFLMEIPNESLFEYNTLTLSYLEKLKQFNSFLENKEIILIKK